MPDTTRIHYLCQTLRRAGIDATVIEASVRQESLLRSLLGLLRINPTLADRTTHRQGGSSGVLAVSGSPISFFYDHDVGDAEAGKWAYFVAVPDMIKGLVQGLSFESVIVRKWSLRDLGLGTGVRWEGTDDRLGILDALNRDEVLNNMVLRHCEFQPPLRITTDRSLGGHWLISSTPFGTFAPEVWPVLEALGRVLQAIPLSLAGQD